MVEEILWITFDLEHVKRRLDLQERVVIHSGVDPRATYLNLPFNGLDFAQHIRHLT